MIMFLTAVLMFVFSGFVFAGSTVETDINAEMKQGQANTNILDFSSHGDNNEAANLLMPTKQDGSFVAAPQPIYWAERSKDILPRLYKDMGWAIWHGAPFNKIKVRRIKKESKDWLSQEKTDTGEPVIEKAQSDDDEIIGLDYWPKNAIETNSARVAMEKESNILTQALSEALYHAWKPKKAKNVLILYNTKYVSQAEVAAIGTAAVAGAVLNSKTDLVGGAASGTGYGTAKSSIYKEPIFWVIAFDQYDAEPLYIPKEEVVSQPLPPSSATQKVEIVVSAAPSVLPAVSKKTEEEAVEKKDEEKVELSPIADIGFDFDKADIKSAEMEKIKEEAERISEDWQNIIVNSLEVRIIGGASEEGTNQYNLTLGEKRAKNCAIAFTKMLINDFHLPAEQVQLVVKYASAGEHEKEYEGLKKNRRVYFLLAKRI
jgi:outer membrane protein OmpA-like peptidoglycan-associated protein